MIKEMYNREVSCKVLEYLGYLSNILRSIGKEDFNFSMSKCEKQELIDLLYEKYTKKEKKKFVITSKNFQLLISHTIMLILFLNDFKYSFEKVLKLTKISESDLKLCCSKIGCSVIINEDDEDSFITLDAPLYIPNSKEVVSFKEITFQ
jgi:hypothetical protein